jgi:hypothetical protein
MSETDTADKTLMFDTAVTSVCYASERHETGHVA